MSIPLYACASQEKATTSILPAEIIECEILPRLPVKSLIRFKSVCKSWNSLIFKDDYLTLMRIERSISNNLNNLESATIIGCMKGLVLLTEHDVSGTLRFTIWNPATKQCLKIPRPSNTDDFEGKNNYISAFGFDSVANDVKIMHVTAIVKRPLVGYIYSCNGGGWRRIAPSNFLFRGHIKNYLNPVIVHGSPFWLWYRNCPSKERLAVISFDVRRESFRLLPNIGDSSGCISSALNSYKLVNFRDSPAIMYYLNKFHWERHKIEIYVFNERCDAWSKMSIGPFELPKPYLEPRYLEPKYFEPVQCFRNGDILFDGFTFGGFTRTCRKLYYGDLQNRTIKKLVAKEDLYYDVSVAYSESSFFIDGMKPFYDKEKEVQFFFVRKTGEDLQKLWHSSAFLRAAGQDMRIIPM